MIAFEALYGTLVHSRRQLRRCLALALVAASVAGGCLSSASAQLGEIDVADVAFVVDNFCRPYDGCDAVSVVEA